ncbi:hypothetical protein [Halarsenatibacter silvermanii]|uniref:Uncharacterized protein n=1 Tax=Halarsenatibacter silvermanii TaxID=321763 RepID=A0A1G9ITZ5_9FIRM|nr:hypothetical protein [Halarsenatibacter silvermanii]SDL28809.1 hypothetical protein SAMN04488692_10364 [Halarsenatibacter silvermanii]
MELLLLALILGFSGYVLIKFIAHKFDPGLSGSAQRLEGDSSDKPVKADGGSEGYGDQENHPEQKVQKSSGLKKILKVIGYILGGAAIVVAGIIVFSIAIPIIALVAFLSSFSFIIFFRI